MVLRLSSTEGPPMTRSKRTSPRSSGYRRSAGRSNTPIRPGAAAAPRTPSRLGSTPRRTSSRYAAGSMATSGAPATRIPRNTSPLAPTANAGWPTGRSPVGPLKARTREHYQAILDAHLVPVFGDQQVGAIRPRDVRRGTRRRWPTGRQCEGTRTACCAPSSRLR